MTEIRTSVNEAMVNEYTKNKLFSPSVLPVKILETKVNEPIYDKNINTLPLIYGRKSVTYANLNDNFYQITLYNLVYSIGQPSEVYGNTMYSTNLYKFLKK